MREIRKYDVTGKQIEDWGDWSFLEWDCDCGRDVVRRARGQMDVQCVSCGRWYNGSGQRLRDDWMNNPSNYDSEIGDMEGFEISQLRSERE